MAAEKLNPSVETFAADAQKAVTEQVEKASKSFETVSAFGQETMEAMLKSQGIAAKAAEELQAEVMAYTKKSVEETVAHAKELGTVHTLAELIEKQTAFAKVSFDAMMRQSARVNEMMVAATKDAMAPISARVAASVDLMKSTAA